jgi:hypothetical protein
MNKHLNAIGMAVLIIFIGLSGCVVGPIINDMGTITFIDLEGGFYAIVGSADYDPLNLPEEFKVEGIQVQFKALRYNGPTFHMWGTPIVLFEIDKMNETNLN